MISGKFKKIETEEEARQTSHRLRNAWKDERIPDLQYDWAIKPELESYRNGKDCWPFSAFVQCLLKIPAEMNCPKTTMLDTGSSSCLYREVLRIAGLQYRYVGMDFNLAFGKLAKDKVTPGVDFVNGDVFNLPFGDGAFDIAVSGGVLAGIYDWQKCVNEIVRVSRKYVLFHRTSLVKFDKNRYYEKLAYDIPVFEAHYNQHAFMDMITRAGLTVIHIVAVEWQGENDQGILEVLCQK
jgi:hypothetical protein